MSKDMVIEALIFKFAPLAAKYPGTHLSDEAELIRASCENIYQQGILQGKYESLVESLKALKGEDNHG